MRSGPMVPEHTRVPANCRIAGRARNIQAMCHLTTLKESGPAVGDVPGDAP